MAATLLRSTVTRTALRASTTVPARRIGLAGVTFTRGKATLPDLPCMSMI
jgi:Fe-Mn family superoxide dismutase